MTTARIFGSRLDNALSPRGRARFADPDAKLHELARELVAARERLERHDAAFGAIPAPEPGDSKGRQRKRRKAARAVERDCYTAANIIRGIAKRRAFTMAGMAIKAAEIGEDGEPRFLARSLALDVLAYREP